MVGRPHFLLRRNEYTIKWSIDRRRNGFSVVYVCFICTWLTECFICLCQYTYEQEMRSGFTHTREVLLGSEVYVMIAHARRVHVIENGAFTVALCCCSYSLSGNSSITKSSATIGRWNMFCTTNQCGGRAIFLVELIPHSRPHIGEILWYAWDEISWEGFGSAYSIVDNIGINLGLSGCVFAFNISLCLFKKVVK